MPSGLASTVYQPCTRVQPNCLSVGSQVPTGRRAAVVERAGPPELPTDTVYEIRADSDVLIRRECW